MHPTIRKMQSIVATGDARAIETILAENVRFLPPTYWKIWTGRQPVAAILGHVGKIFTDFRYRRVLGEDSDWALEFQCRIGDLDAVGVDLITLNAKGLIEEFEVVMRPHKSIGALRDAMNARISTDPAFLAFAKAMK